MTPTKEEIDNALAYYREADEKKGFKEYIEPMIKKHGFKWVNSLLTTVLLSEIIRKA
jgi:hypothetical protein